MYLRLTRASPSSQPSSVFCTYPELINSFLNFVCESRINSFWRSWASDYITLLHNRSKWRRSRKEIKEGDLVLVVDDQQPRSTWKLARVIEAVPEVDEHVRKATVKTADKKTLLWDRESLVLLEMDVEQEIDQENDVDESQLSMNEIESE